MAKVILKSKNPNRFGQKIVLPFVGEVQLNEKGEVEVEENVAEHVLTTNSKSWLCEDNFIKKDLDETSDEDDDENEEDQTGDVDDSGNQETEEDEDSDDENEEDQEDEDSLEDLEKLELPELIDMAKQLGFKASQYKKYKENKKLMIKFLKDQQ